MEDDMPVYFLLYWKLKAMELIDEVEPLVLAIANREAQLSTQEARHEAQG